MQQYLRMIDVEVSESEFLGFSGDTARASADKFANLLPKRLRFLYSTHKQADAFPAAIYLHRASRHTERPLETLTGHELITALIAYTPTRTSTPSSRPQSLNAAMTFSKWRLIA